MVQSNRSQQPQTEAFVRVWASGKTRRLLNRFVVGGIDPKGKMIGPASKIGLTGAFSGGSAYADPKARCTVKPGLAATSVPTTLRLDSVVMAMVDQAKGLNMVRIPHH